MTDHHHARPILPDGPRIILLVIVGCIALIAPALFAGDNAMPACTVEVVK